LETRSRERNPESKRKRKKRRAHRICPKKRGEKRMYLRKRETRLEIHFGGKGRETSDARGHP